MIVQIVVIKPSQGKVKNILKKINTKLRIGRGISLKKQRPGQGPLSPAFREFAKTSTADPVLSETHGVRNRRGISPVGIDLARIFTSRSFWVLFVDTGGSGASPWRKLIILDDEYKGKGQVKTPARLAMISHELTHLLQREINQPHYWPGGALRPARGRRWIGDSTNYMEVIAYLVSWTVEHDFTLARHGHPWLSDDQECDVERELGVIRNRLALFTGSYARDACRRITELFPDNQIYQQNLLTERRYDDRRIPSAPWHTWLRQMGFSRQAVDHIMILAARGKSSGDMALK